MTRPEQAIRILLADDSREFRQLLSLLLSRDDCFDVVAEANNGIEAIEMTKEKQPDVILLDISMPGMDGLQALPALKESHPPVKVIVLSSFSAAEMKETTAELGAEAYLEKGELMETIRQTILSVCATE